MTFTFDFSELDRLASDLVSGAATVERRAETDVLDPAADELFAKSQASVPVDTGRLKSSGEIDESAGAREVGYTAPYAAYVEFGTYKDAPQPFLFPHVDGVVRDMEDDLGDVADDVL